MASRYMGVETITMGETENPKGDALQQKEAGQPSAEDKGSTSQAPAKTSSEAEIQKIISDERAAAGRKIAEATRQSETASAKAKALETELAKTTSSLSEIQDRIDQQELEKA